MTRTIALTALIAAMAAAPAAAQIGPIIGLRADVHAGWDGPGTHQRTDVGTSGATMTTKDDGLIYGAEIGYDRGFGPVLLGVYAGVDGATTKECDEIFTEVRTCARTGRNIALGVRAGVHVTPALLVYVKGGYSNGQVKVDYQDFVTPGNSFAVKEDMDGYHLGAGAQLSLFGNLYAKLEYVRTDYRDYADTQGAATISGGVDRDNVIFGVGIRF